MYSDLIFGNTSALKAAQCGQVIDAYSVMVTAAFAGPSAMSGNDTGFATSVALCATASVISRSGEKPASAARPVNDKAAVKARRVMIKASLPDWRDLRPYLQNTVRSLARNPRGGNGRTPPVAAKASISLDCGPGRGR